MASNRSLRRNVHFYDASRPDQALGGLRVHPSVTQQNLEILIIADCSHYDIKPNSPGGRISITDEPCIARVLSRTASSRDEKFRRRVRERDGRCVITGVVNPDADTGIIFGEASGFDAAHIFPLSKEEECRNQGLSRWITNREEDGYTGINSCQNGLLMRSQIHHHFDGLDFSINPDDNYKITSFDADVEQLDGRILDPICRDPSDYRSVRDELLRWHFRQAVLANMRGSGEPVFEFDFPPRSDMIGDILSGPQAPERIEAELFSRLSDVALAH
ncbi:hypothetical protein V1504DRAFT_439678 [Lipomyces starkeyi]